MKISVVIPTYNEAKYIQATLQQFQMYRKQGLEIILSDNGSSDSTCALAQSLVDLLVTLPTTTAHSTIGACRNRGASAAQGEIIWFLDADVLVPQFEQVCNYIRKTFVADRSLVAATLPIRFYPAVERRIDHFWWTIVNCITWLQNHWLKTGGSPGDCQIVRRSAFEQVGGFNEIATTAEDHDLFHRLITLGKVQLWWQYHATMSPRRIHRDGWLKVLWQWSWRWVANFIFHRPDQAVWKAHR